MNKKKELAIMVVKDREIPQGKNLKIQTAKIL